MSLMDPHPGYDFLCGTQLKSQEITPQKIVKIKSYRPEVLIVQNKVFSDYGDYLTYIDLKEKWKTQHTILEIPFVKIKIENILLYILEHLNSWTHISTASQRALLASKMVVLKSMICGGKTISSETISYHITSEKLCINNKKEIIKKIKASDTGYRNGLKILRYGTDSLILKVQEGFLEITTAAKIASLPESQQQFEIKRKSDFPIKSLKTTKKSYTTYNKMAKYYGKEAIRYLNPDDIIDILGKIGQEDFELLETLNKVEEQLNQFTSSITTYLNQRRQKWTQAKD